MVIPSSVLGPILSTDHRRLRIAPTNGTDPIPDYAILTRKRSANSDPQRTIAQLDHRGRLLRQWDPQQVHALGLATTSSWGDAQFQLLQNHLDLSTEYTRESTERDDSGQITGNDWGEILQIAAPDPDKILIGGVLQSNGPAVRQVASYAYVNNNPVFAQYPEQTDGAWSWNDTFDIVTLAIDETGNRFIQDVDSGTGLITRQRWEHPGPVWQNDIIPTDVNNDGITMPLDALLILNYIGAHAMRFHRARSTSHRFTMSTAMASSLP